MFRQSVANHQPVPLEPLEDVLKECKPDDMEIIYVEKWVYKYLHTPEEQTPGWYTVTGLRPQIQPLGPAEEINFKMFVDKQKTMARKLQPAEILQFVGN